MRVLVYVDSVYRRVDGRVHGELPFTRFLVALGTRVELTIIGRLDPAPGPARYPLPDGVRFVALPHYESLTRPLDALRSLRASLAIFSRECSRVDVCLLFGPYLHAQLFALQALRRRRRVVLGVRQDFPRYVRARRPGRRWMHWTADVLEAGWRALARRAPTVVVGPELARHYRRAPGLLTIAVSLVSAQDVLAGEQALERADGDELRLLSVGRLDAEKNPLLLAEAIAELRRRDGRWRLTVCGDGPLEGDLAARLSELGVDGAAQLRGHVASVEDLMRLYRESDVFLHVSLTEGVPQVLFEAFASGLPVVATAVGGVPDAVGDAAVLVPPRSVASVADAVSRLGDDPDLRRRLARAGLDRARELTLERQIDALVGFLAA